MSDVQHADVQHIPCHPEQMVPDGMHKHLCNHCGNAWAHSDCYMGHVKAHTCNASGAQQWNKHFNDAEIMALRDRMLREMWEIA